MTQDDLPLPIYSTPGSRWIDPALGMERSEGMPKLFEVFWRVGEKDVSCDDPSVTTGDARALRIGLLRTLAVYIAGLHGASSGAVRYHYYCRKETPGYWKIDANSDLIACAFDLSVHPAAEVFLEFAQTRAKQRYAESVDLSTVSFVPIVLFGAEGRLIFYVESPYGVPRANAYFNTRALEFLARLSEALPKPWEVVRSSRDAEPQIDFLSFEPLLERQFEVCPPQLRATFARQLIENVSKRRHG